MISKDGELYQKLRFFKIEVKISKLSNSDRPDLQPVAVNGWFWTSELQKIAPSTDRQQTDWSENGGIGQPQPDNRELQQGGARENCIAVLNNFYNDGVHWVSWEICFKNELTENFMNQFLFLSIPYHLTA